VCPILRDNTQRRLNYVRVYYVDNHSGGEDAHVLACALRSNNIWGNSELDEQGLDTLVAPPEHPVDGLEGIGAGHWTFWEVDQVGGGDVNHETSYTLTCLLPPRSGPTQQSPLGHSFIGSIVVEERD
jgi:hypothetical protein